MDEGSALLHHLERKFNNVLTCLATHGSFTSGNLPANLKELICVCGYDKDLMTKVQDHFTVMLDKWHDVPRTEFAEQLNLTDDFAGDFHQSRFILICVTVDDCQNPVHLCKLIKAYQCAKLRKANTLVLVHQSDDDKQNGNHNPSNHALGNIYKTNPEIRLLSQKKRLCTVGSEAQMESIIGQEVMLHEWLLDKLPDDSDTLEHMDYKDIYQIFSRELQHRFPEMQVFMRMFLLCFFGTISVLLTIAIIVAVTKDTGLSSDMRRVQTFLRTYIESQRTGKSEWGWQYNAMAITALQLNDPSWCFNSAENQRSVDRMEISLLAELSRLKPSHRGQSELTPTYLAMYVNGLVSTFQNPRDFHDHDLVEVLESYLTQYAPYQRLDSFVLAGYVIALCNTGVQMDPRHAEMLLQWQKSDGSYPLGVDEAAVVALALSCYPHYAKAKVGMTMSVNYLVNQRNYDGSYGSPYTTALVLQAFNESQTPFERRHYETSMNWLLRQAKTKSVLRNLDIAAQVLLTLSGKTMVDPRELTGYIQQFTSDQLEFSQNTRGQYTETYKYINPDQPSEVVEAPTTASPEPPQAVEEVELSEGLDAAEDEETEETFPGEVEDAKERSPTPPIARRRTLNVLTPENILFQTCATK